MNFVYLFSKILTYPGAFLKGFWEHCVSLILNIEVFSKNYLMANEACGHVECVPPKTPTKAFCFAFFSWFPQAVLGIIFFVASAPPLLLFGLSFKDTSLFVLELVLLFLGISLLCNAFPKWEDALCLWELFYSKKKNIVKNSQEKEESSGLPGEEELVVHQSACVLAKILLAPANLFFLVGAWMEKYGITVWLSVGLIVVSVIFR